MIGAIADDFTGAAEVAGAAFAAGRTAEVHTRFDPSTEAEVVVVDTDTRASPAREAERRVTEAALQMRQARPDWVYKKVDSLLRGHVALEAHVVRRAFDLARIRLVPVNPSRARIIQDGRYLVDGVPLHKTPLAADPMHPRTTSEVDRLVFGMPGPLGREAHAGVPSSGLSISIPDAEDWEDLTRLAGELKEDELPAGAAPFFQALLARRSPTGERPDASVPRGTGPALFVCGSLAAWRAGRGETASNQGLPVCMLPDALLNERVAGEDVERFRALVHRRLEGRTGMIAIGRSDELPGVSPDELVARLTQVVVSLQEQYGNVYVEGGATAAAMAAEAGWTRLRVVALPGRGAVTLQSAHDPRAPRITTKSGSYDWPASVWEDSARD